MGDAVLDRGGAPGVRRGLAEMALHPVAVVGMDEGGNVEQVAFTRLLAEQSAGGRIGVEKRTVLRHDDDDVGRVLDERRLAAGGAQHLALSGYTGRDVHDDSRCSVGLGAGGQQRDAPYLEVVTLQRHGHALELLTVEQPPAELQEFRVVLVDAEEAPPDEYARQLTELRQQAAVEQRDDPVAVVCEQEHRSGACDTPHPRLRGPQGVFGGATC